MPPRSPICESGASRPASTLNGSNVRLSAFGRFALLAAEKRRTLIISPWSYGVQHHCQPLGSVLHLVTAAQGRQRELSGLAQSIRGLEEFRRHPTHIPLPRSLKR